MESIIKWLQGSLLNRLPAWDLLPVSGKARDKLRLSPEQLLWVIHSQEVTEWALAMTHWFARPRLERRGAGAPVKYRDNSILLMAVVQSVWRKSYEEVIDY